MDDKDFIFISKLLNEKEEKEFSDFLKLRKLKTKQNSIPKKKKTVELQLQ